MSHQLNRFFFILILVVAVFMPNVLFGGWDEALRLYESEQYEDAAKHLELLSEQGRSEAKILLAVMLFNGIGMEKNEESAVRLLEEAVDDGNPEAMWRLGWLLLERKELTRFTNEKKPLDLINEAATKDIGEAQLMLGNLYRKGELVEKNYDSSVYWFEKAATKNIAEAIHSLAVAFYNGWGVKRNYAEAAHLLTLASEQGFTSSTFNLGTMYRDGKGVSKDLIKAHELFLVAAREGNKDAMTQLSRNYFKGSGTNRNYIEGARWLYKSKTE